MRRLLVMVLFVAACSSSNRNGMGPGGSGGAGSGGAGGSTASGPPATHDVVDPSLPMGVVGSFDGSTPQAGAFTLAYPDGGAILPHDLAAIDVQWTKPSGTNVYRVTFAVETGDRLRGFVPSADWIPPTDEWMWLMDRAAGHGIMLTVDGGSLSGSSVSNVVGSTAVPLRVSNDDATGALFYFATTGDQISGDGTLERLEVGSQMPAKYLNKSNDGGRCVGCHTLTRDGTKLAFTFFDLTGVALGTPVSLGLVDATDPTKQLAATGQNLAHGTFSPDGSKLLTSFQGKLTLRDGSTGAVIMNVPTSGPALYPDWSPDGSKIVFVRPSALCQPQGINIAQDSIFVYGGSLVTLDVQGNNFTNEKVILQAGASDNNYYPAWSPDGSYIAFTRADLGTKTSWGMAGQACAGKDGSGLSYDNPSATIWLLPSTGGMPIELTAANGEPMHTNSWPKWGPKPDGQYLWLSFSSTRPYGNVLAGPLAHHQIWITAIAKPSEVTGDPSATAVWFPFQDTSTKNHIGEWSVKVGDYMIQ